ncbi:hypothetical protein, partial [uncultured Sphingobacterium sp.]
PFFTRKPLLETVKGFFRLSTPVLPVQCYCISSVPPTGPDPQWYGAPLLAIPPVLCGIYHHGHFISHMEVNIRYLVNSLQ